MAEPLGERVRVAVGGASGSASLELGRRRSRRRRAPSSGPRGPRRRCGSPTRALAQLLLEGLDQLDQGQGVGVEVVGERVALGDRRRARSRGCRPGGPG